MTITHDRENYFLNISDCSAYFDSSQLQWNDARSKCRLVGNDSDVPLEDIKVKLQNSVNTFGWIDALGTYQPWMEYIGKTQYILTTAVNKR